jgi:hypothetical protein
MPVNCETDNNDPTEKMADTYFRIYNQTPEADRHSLLGTYQSTLPHDVFSSLLGKIAKAEEYLDTQREYLAAQDFAVDFAEEKADEVRKMSLDEVREAKDIRRKVDETRRGVEILVQHLPDAKKPSHIEYAEAVAIMKRKGGDMTDRTLRNWLKAGNAGRVKLPISWDDLASTASWSAWVDVYLGKEKIRITRKRIISEYAGETETAKARRRSPTA